MSREDRKTSRRTLSGTERQKWSENGKEKKHRKRDRQTEIESDRARIIAVNSWRLEPITSNITMKRSTHNFKLWRRNGHRT